MFQVLKTRFQSTHDYGQIPPRFPVKWWLCGVRWCPSCMRSKVSITLKDIQHNGTQHPGDGLPNANCHTPRRRFLEDLRFSRRIYESRMNQPHIIKTNKTQGFYMVSQCCV